MFRAILELIFTLELSSRKIFSQEFGQRVLAKLVARPRRSTNTKSGRIHVKFVQSPTGLLTLHPQSSVIIFFELFVFPLMPLSLLPSSVCIFPLRRRNLTLTARTHFYMVHGPATGARHVKVFFSSIPILGHLRIC